MIKIRITKYIFLIISLLFIDMSITHASRGCCSHHGGQDYCDTAVGKWVCKDGTYSPTCACKNLKNNNSNSNNTNNVNKNTYVSNDNNLYSDNNSIYFDIGFFTFISWITYKIYKENKK